MRRLYTCLSVYDRRKSVIRGYNQRVDSRSGVKALLIIVIFGRIGQKWKIPLSSDEDIGKNLKLLESQESFKYSSLDFVITVGRFTTKIVFDPRVLLF